MSSLLLDNSFLNNFKQVKSVISKANLNNFFNKASRSNGRKRNNRNINLSTISLSINKQAYDKKEIISRNILPINAAARSKDKTKLNDLKKNLLVENNDRLENSSDKLLKKIDELSMKNNYHLFNNFQGSFANQAKELLTRFNQPHSKSQNKTKNKKLETIYSRNFSSHQIVTPSNSRTISSSHLKIEKMKKYIDSLFPNKASMNSSKGLHFSHIQDNEEEPKKKDIFEPSYRRKITNKIYDFKKFKIFVDYNERKKNPENLLAFAKNNQIIMSSIQDKFAENQKERSIENLDEDINVDDLVEDYTKSNNNNNEQSL